MKIAITVNKSDVWFCKICVASIRYFYPDVPIYLIKDDLKGSFSTTEIEQNWDVNLIKFDKNKFGWSAAKILFYTDERFKGETFLVIDADIVFAGKLLDKLIPISKTADIIVSPEPTTDPTAEWVKKTYFDLENVKCSFPAYQFPGYFFNAGQLVVTIGKMPKEDIAYFFDFNGYPYWTQLKQFPLVDQSMLNVLVPLWEQSKKVVVNASYPYMIWSEAPSTKLIPLDAIKAAEDYPVLIHWAGAFRTPQLSLMSRSDILQFFEDYYYSKISFGRFKAWMRRVPYVVKNSLRSWFHRIKKLIKT